MIIRALGQQPISVDTLARLTGASPVTVRRDLTDLEGHGLLRRVHGGAVAVDLRGRPLPYALRAAENADGKAAIAATVAGLVSDDMSVVLDNGSTVVAVAEALVGRPLTALCLSLRTAVALGASREPTIVTPGGPVAPESLRATASASLVALDGFRADLAVVGACSATPTQGLTVTTYEDAQIKKAILAASARVVLAATGDKLQRTSSFRFGSLEDLDDLVTTRDAPPSALDAFREAGVRVHLA
ncbi:DeoR/GlpR family DNA-binding transcription regulator [Luteococcus peritonei]|uniref:Lactose phosphotransferase system repressor n=1 Tax=Luteococcus peritonei TaxID=88874 RepID=A0ABW4RTG7_9ACTN